MALPLSLMMVALSLAALGIYATIGPLWSLPTAILTGTGAAAGLALVNAVGNLGGLAGPAVIGVLNEANGDFTLALLFLAGALSAGASITLLFGRLAWTGGLSPCVIQ
jgi:ACS family tartrate transporter-like MFS transporter